MEFTNRTDVEGDMASTIDAVTAALKEQGFGVLTRIDVQATLKEKLDIDVEPQVILGACNPQLAHRALQADPRIGALLPCNVVVRTEGARTVIEALDPKLIAEIPDNDTLRPIAEDAGRRIRAALDTVASAAR
jgi:uncharacterized protein (DUF302 family)